MVNNFFEIFCAMAFGISLLYHTHMFQLGGYHRDAHLRWVANNAGALCAKYTFLLPALILSLFDNKVCIGIAAFFMLVTAVMFLPRTKAKKDLVYTSRVKRMLATSIVLFALVYIITIFVPRVRVLLALAVLLDVFILLVADIINSPLEKAIKQRFINQAKKALREKKNLKIIGITGSYGKTSTKYFLTKILQQKYNVLMTPASYNTPMGVVKTVRESLKPSHEIFVCEMGAKYKGDIKEICDIVCPTCGIITSIGPQHLESFKTMETIVKTKFELADALPDQSLLVLNFDNEYIKNASVKQNAVSYGVENQDVQFKANILSVSDKGTQFEMLIDGKTHIFTTRLLGAHNVQNLAGCIALSYKLSVDITVIKTAVSRLEPVPHRLQLIDAGEKLTIIDDAFNANPTGTHASLMVMSKFEGLKIIVTPGMIELGEKQKELNEAFGRECAQICDYVFLVGGRIADDVYCGAKSVEGENNDKIRRFSTVQDAVNAARTIVSDKHKYVLLENDLPDNY